MKSVFILLLLVIGLNIKSQETCPGPDWEIISLEFCYGEYFTLGVNPDTALIYNWSAGNYGFGKDFKETNPRQVFYARKSENIYLNIYDKSFQQLKTVQYIIHVKPSHVAVSPQYQFQEPNSKPVMIAGKTLLKVFCMTGYPDYYQPQWKVTQDSTIKSYTWIDNQGNIVGYGDKFEPDTPGVYTVKADQYGCYPTATGIVYAPGALVQPFEKAEVITNDLVFDWSTPKDTLGFLDPFPYEICLENTGNRFIEFALSSGRYPFHLEIKTEADSVWHQLKDFGFSSTRSGGLSAYLHPGMVSRTATPEYLSFPGGPATYQYLLDSMPFRKFQPVWLRIRKTGLSGFDTITVISKPLRVVLHNYKSDSTAFRLANMLIASRQCHQVSLLAGFWYLDKCDDSSENIKDTVCACTETLKMQDSKFPQLIAIARIMCEEKYLCRLREEIRSNLDLEPQLKEIQRAKKTLEQIKSMGDPMLNQEIERSARGLILYAIDDIAVQFIGPDLTQYLGEPYSEEFRYFYRYKDIKSILLSRLNDQ